MVLIVLMFVVSILLFGLFVCNLVFLVLGVDMLVV